MTYLFPSVTDLDDRTSTPVEYWSEGRGAVRSLAIAEAATRVNAPFLVICDNNESVEVFCREIGYFCHYHESLKVLTLPDWETLPYDNFSPHQDIISDRLRALFHLPNFKKGILVVSITSLMHRFPPPELCACKHPVVKNRTIGETGKTARAVTSCKLQSL
ncbi:hypothetical protein N9D99_04710 [Gammaproteobacteria bacterium]|nr:hypothetical protein [Gammaproteobacteria bacterium]MDB2443904.1 hypothetical protein [Gammaproteobacteria bacterium]